MPRDRMTGLGRRLLCSLLLLQCLGTADAAVVRGRLQRFYPNRALVPAPGIPVTVWCLQFGRSPAYYSLYDGMFYLSNIPPGVYNLEIWVRPNQPMVFPITVREPNTDIPPINVP